ncbi:hypothetical protein PIB30_090690 [Stylosanthes scabra]|uniref:Uncharacterized protein n=1 Tax=Stylosanthes scabra TaxID=79078 RepID=A0ABU6RUR8_9FABA|nr:hypothetical protein [Stylosanthes scabra]
MWSKRDPSNLIQAQMGIKTSCPRPRLSHVPNVAQTWVIQPQNVTLFQAEAQVSTKCYCKCCVTQLGLLVWIPLQRNPAFKLRNSEPAARAAAIGLSNGNEKEQKEAWKASKEENRATGQKQSYSDSNRGLTPRRHYPCLGMTEPQVLISLIQHPTPRRDARRQGMDEAARKITLHQGLNA